MDLKEPGNLLYLVGETKDELGGSHFALVNGLAGGQVPTVDPAQAPTTFAAVHAAIRGGLVRACHDLSEGGLAVAAAEMAFAGGLGRGSISMRFRRQTARASRPCGCSANRTRGSCAKCRPSGQASLNGRWPACRSRKLVKWWVMSGSLSQAAAERVIDADIKLLKEAWQATFRW